MTIWDSIYKNYQNGGPAWGTLTDDLHPDFLKFMEQTSFEGKNALDIGCGNGKYLQFLNTLGFAVTGLDSSATAIDMAKKALDGKGKFIVVDMYDHTYPVDIYDLIISYATLHHGTKSQVAMLLRKIYDSLATNGKVFLSLPSDDSMKNWAMMAEHETLPDGTRIPLIGPEKGLPHSSFSEDEIQTLFAKRYSDTSIKLDDRGRWIITGTKDIGTRR
jgi:2-polyprenyl-3-methyl-5-hydroxy-6-metoxy-1,4-benzoquinol methylase